MHYDLTIDNGIVISSIPSASPRLRVDGRDLSLPRNAVVLPGFVDTHCHLMGLGEKASHVQLMGAATMTECAQRMALRAISARDGEWLVGFGWNESEWLDRRVPDLASLDSAVPDHPAALYRIDTHAVWVNSAALRAAGIEPHEIEGGSIESDAFGRPTGLLIDNAVKLLERSIPAPGVDQQRAWLATAIERCLSFGITEVHDMNVSPGWLEAMAQLADRGGFGIRSSLFLEAQKDEWRVIGSPRRIAERIEAVGVKYFTDGALGSRGAWLLEPYSDAPHTRGISLLDPDELSELATPAIERGFAVATHAIGDAANRIALDSYERLRDRFPDALLRIEHAQIVHPDDLPRFARIGVVPAVQPTHCTSDAPMAEARLGGERIEHAYRWRSLLASGVPVIGGSDFPVESPDPLAGMRAFHRRRPAGADAAWHGDETITPEESLAAFTAWAPLGVPGNVRRGTLEPGSDADLVVLTAEPFEDPDAAVVMTMVGGRIVFEI